MSPPGYQLLPYDCHEGNYTVPNALSAERAEDRALAEDPKKGIVRAPPRRHAGERQRAGDRPAQRWRIRC